MLTPTLLVAAAMCSVLVALLHVYVIAKGPWAYRFFGAGEKLAGMAEQGSWIPNLLTSGITLVFFIFAAYYFAGAGLLPKPPLFRIGLIGIAAIYTLRGALLLPGWIFGMKMSSFDIWSSIASLTIGLLHCAAALSYFGTSTIAEARG